MDTKFIKRYINDDDLFNRLSKDVIFEPVESDGRLGTTLVRSIDDSYPIVRTTSKYENPPQNFRESHHELVNRIKLLYPELCLDFNNILTELYDNRYKTMRFHSDLACDLEYDSYICLFSVYERELSSDDTARTLRVKEKNSDDTYDITLDNNSVVLFSTDTNRNHSHQIILTGKNCPRWLGLTFRLSNRFINFIDKIPHIDGNVLTIATADELVEFRKLRAMENKQVHFTYPIMNYTVSKSDLMQPI